jgi:2',3'-cyclic-nucleotide 2'-phosphodiesterase (5'-nucleotidase family)
LLLKPYRSIELPNGLKVAVVGSTTKELVTATNPQNVTSIEMDDPVDTLSHYLPEADKQSDLLIILSHCGIAADKRLAGKYTNVDLIVGGHNHNLYLKPQVENGIPIVQVGQYGEYIGRADIVVKEDRGAIEKYRVYPIKSDMPRDPKLAKIIDAAKEEAAKRGSEVIGESMVVFNGEREFVRRKESNLGNFVCDLIRKRFGADVVVLNGGGFRASIQTGPVKVSDVLSVFPFGNTLTKMSLSGSVIKQALDYGLSNDPMDNPGQFLQVSGLKLKIDGDQAVNITVKGKPLDENKMYTVITNDFVAGGGDGFFMFKEIKEKFKTGYTLADLVMETIRARKKIEASTDGRIERVSPWKKKE